LTIKNIKGTEYGKGFLCIKINVASLAFHQYPSMMGIVMFPAFTIEHSPWKGLSVLLEKYSATTH